MASSLWSVLMPVSILLASVGCRDEKAQPKTDAAPRNPVVEISQPIDNHIDNSEAKPSTLETSSGSDISTASVQIPKGFKILRDMQYEAEPLSIKDFWLDWSLARVWKELQDESGLKRGTKALITRDGKKHPLGNYYDEMHWNMQFFLKFPAKADFFHQAYREELLFGFLDAQPEVRKMTEDWIMKFLYYFGSRHADYDMLLTKHKDLYAAALKDAELMRRIKAFVKRTSEFRKAEDLYQPLADLSQATPERKLKVMILSTPGGGGHLTVAESIRGYLDTVKASTVETIWVDIAGFKDDPLYVASGGNIHTEDTYNIFFQKELNEKKWNLYWNAINHIQRYIPDRQVQHIAERIVETQPDIIFNTTSHKSEFIQLGYEFAIPTVFVSTDYMVQYFLIEYLDTLDPRLIRYAAPSELPEYFVALRELPYRAHTYSPFEQWYNPAMTEAIRNYIVERNADWDWERFRKDAPIFDLLGFPVRSAFNHKLSVQSLAAARVKEGVRPDAQVATLAMGRQGVGSLGDILKVLVRDADKLDAPLDLFVVAGANESLQAELSAKYGRPDLHPKLRIHVKGLQSSDEMSVLYQMSDVLITKPGGATTAEAIATGSRVLAPGYHMWEYPNLQFLEMVGLGRSVADLHGFSDIADELVTMLANKDAAGSTDLAKLQIDWQRNLMTIIDSALTNVSTMTSDKN